MQPSRKLRVLIVDDSAIVRKSLAAILEASPDIGSISTAPDAYVARNKIVLEKPDVMTLDLQMPGMDGLTFLRKVMHYHPLRVVVISSLARDHCDTAFEALRLGAVDVLGKPGGPYSVEDLRRDLPRTIKAAAEASLRIPKQGPATPETSDLARPSCGVIAVAASTGGVQAIETLLKDVPTKSPGIVIVQHIPPVFSGAFAERLNR